MNVTISGALSPLSSMVLSPPFDEVDRRIMDFARAMAEMLDSEEPLIAAEVSLGLVKLMEAKTHFGNAGMMHIKVNKGETLEAETPPSVISPRMQAARAKRTHN